MNNSECHLCGHITKRRLIGEIVTRDGESIPVVICRKCGCGIGAP